MSEERTNHHGGALHVRASTGPGRHRLRVDQLAAGLEERLAEIELRERAHVESEWRFDGAAACDQRMPHALVQSRREIELWRRFGAMIVAWTVCTISAGCTASAQCRSRATSRCSTSLGRGGCGGCSARVMAHTTIDRFRYTIEQMPPASIWHRATTSGGCGRSSTSLPSRASSTATTAPSVSRATVAGDADVGGTVPGR